MPFASSLLAKHNPLRGTLRDLREIFAAGGETDVAATSRLGQLAAALTDRFR